MPIIFPDKLKGVTSGMLREIRQQGWTGAKGGLFAESFVDRLSNQIKTSDFSKKTHPLGEFIAMTKETIDQIDELTFALQRARTSMVDAAKDANKSVIDISRHMRENSEKLGAALEKFSKITANTNFAETVKQAESLVSCLERLAELERSGSLEKIIVAMSKT